MLSQALPNEMVVPTTSIFMPQRVKSVYVKLVDDARNSKLDELNRIKNSDSMQTGISDFSDSPNIIRISSGTFKRIPTAHEIVSHKNLNERIMELEKTNLTLKRMLDLVKNDPSRNIDRISGTAPRLLVHRSTVNNSLSLPTQREGRIGSSWRHIKQTNSYSNSNLLFIDGTVRINDTNKYPQKIYGYPPKLAQYDEDLIGFHNKTASSSIDLNPEVERVKNRPLSLKNFDNQFHDRAKTGFEYWPKEKKFPENNKRKAKLYTTGAYKTYYGLSDSLLKL